MLSFVLRPGVQPFQTAAGPLKLKTGSGQFLYDDLGNQYLDCVNNVCHVGHCHPRVVQAAASQLGMRACIDFSLRIRPGLTKTKGLGGSQHELAVPA